MGERGPVSARTGAGLEPRLFGLVGSGIVSAGMFSVGGFLPLLVPLALISPVPLAVHRLQGGFASAWLATVLGAALVAATNVPTAVVVYLLFAVSGLLIAEAMARGRGLVRGCAWAFFLLAALVVLSLATASQGIADSMLASYDSGNAGFVEQLRQSATPPDVLAEWQDYVRQGRAVLAVVYPAFLVIFAAALVAVNAAFLRLYLLRRDPGWLEDGEFERVRFPLPLVVAFVLGGAAVAVEVLRPVGYNVLLVVAFFFGLQGLAVVGFYARRLAAPPLVRGLALVLVLVNPWAPQLLALLGLFDNWFDFRRFAEPPAGSRPGAGRDSNSRT